MNKVELAKMIGLTLDSYMRVKKHDIVDCIECDWQDVQWSFCGEKIIVRVDNNDFSEDKLDIQLLDLVHDGDDCIKQVEDLLWERAANEYLECVHDATMFFCSKR